MVRKVPSFLGVGAIGFLVDAAIFFGLTVSVGLGYGWSRVAASLVALTTTWMLNRTSTFANDRADTAPIEFLRYLLASSAGALANFAILSMIAPFDQALRHVPAYIAGALVGLVVNFLLYDKFVFYGRPGTGRSTPKQPENAP